MGKQNRRITPCTEVIKGNMILVANFVCRNSKKYSGVLPEWGHCIVQIVARRGYQSVVTTFIRTQYPYPPSPEAFE